MTRPSRYLSTRWLAALGIVALGSVGVFILRASQPAAGAAVISIDPSQQFQEIRGWEATDQVGLFDTPSQEYLDELLDAAVDLGITRLRVEAPASIEHTRDVFREFRDGRINDREYRCLRYSTVNDNGDPARTEPGGFRFERLDRTMESVVLPLRARLQQQGERLWINVNYVAFTNTICRGNDYVHDRPDEYAEFVLAVYQHLQSKYGLAPDSWEVALEPDNTKVWNGKAMANAMVRTAARLQDAGFVPAFIAPSTTAAGRALSHFEPAWNTPGLRPFLRELSYHRYDSPWASTVAAIGSAGQKRGIDTSMLEKIGASHHDLHQDLTLGRVSAWQQYTLAYPDGDTGAHYFIIDPAAPAGRRATLSASGRYLRQYFRAIRPGARRIGATSDHDGFKPVAARNRDGRLTVVVSTSRPGQLTIRRLEPGSYRVSCWTERSALDVPSSQCDQTVPVASPGDLVTSIPGAGVLSVTQLAAQPPS